MISDASLRRRMKLLKWGINWYPPYLGAGIKLEYVNDEFTHCRVRMKLRWYNLNLVSTHFGGSLYSMCDPFYVFILIANLGTNYIIWDKAATIDYVKPGKGKVLADFKISKERIEEIRQTVEEKGKGTFDFECEVYHEKDKSTVARLTKSVYVRKRSN